MWSKLFLIMWSFVWSKCYLVETICYHVAAYHMESCGTKCYHVMLNFNMRGDFFHIEAYVTIWGEILKNMETLVMD
jgi:hypothetical protein